MHYISTRGGVAPVTFSKAVMMGLATDGGLLLPEKIPTIDQATLIEWSNLSFADLAKQVIGQFVDDNDIPKVELDRLIDNSFASFNHPDVTPVVKVGDRYILELFHGPTLAFKDVALQFLGNLFEYILAQQGGQLNIVGATSGDTGSAAIYGVRGRKGIQIFILHPSGRVSPIQERQMTTVLDDNVHNIAIKGTFDDGQAIVKQLFNDLDFKKQYQLGAVNSINWARILAQIVYYFYAWGRVSSGTSRAVTFSVPTGNFGDIFAGYMAQRMGLPIENLILATNRNDILSRFFNTGTYRAGTVAPTISPSMDIQISSNFERYLYYLLDEDSEKLKLLMAQLDSEGGFSVEDEIMAKTKPLFWARAVSEEETLATIKTVCDEDGYILDPHTAVGVCAAKDRSGAICLATAHPAKFGQAVEDATGRIPEVPAALHGVMERPTKCLVLPASFAEVRSCIKEVLG
ncbi:MAG: threonine synthase [Magnetococcales bacterium]|nr:threonine synthase [Magnetococcales bacterium]